MNVFGVFLTPQVSLWPGLFLWTSEQLGEISRPINVNPELDSRIDVLRQVPSLKWLITGAAQRFLLLELNSL